MESIIEYNGFEVLSPDPRNLGGTAINRNFKKFMEVFPVLTTTFYDSFSRQVEQEQSQ